LTHTAKDAAHATSSTTSRTPHLPPEPSTSAQHTRRSIYPISQGDCLVHSGWMRHGGVPITRGERYLLVGFVDYA
jgi:hypothetical protein